MSKIPSYPTQNATMTNDKTHTTNYFDTLIEVAPDTKASCGSKPAPKGDQMTVAAMQYERLANNPYQFTSDDVIFHIFAERNDLPESERPQARQAFFSKGQPCLRSSPLPKTYGFGIHSDSQGKVALMGMETERYEALQQDPAVKKVKVMRSSRK
jgi:hypothetical protein